LLFFFHTVLDARAACAGLGCGPHPEQRLMLQGPLAIDPICIQRLSANLAFLAVSDSVGTTCELIAKVRDGFLSPMDIDALCTTCSALNGAEVYPEVDTDTGLHSQKSSIWCGDFNQDFDKKLVNIRRHPSLEAPPVIGITQGAVPALTFKNLWQETVYSFTSCAPAACLGRWSCPTLRTVPPTCKSKSSISRARRERKRQAQALPKSGEALSMTIARPSL
jgi:hypothetical protein